MKAGFMMWMTQGCHAFSFYQRISVAERRHAGSRGFQPTDLESQITLRRDQRGPLAQAARVN
ncbi:MAG: hypothetical protein ABIQ99_14240, partial [Thermoflexales bacterium]